MRLAMLDGGPFRVYLERRETNEVQRHEVRPYQPGIGDRFTMTRLEKITYENFGDDADRLLNAHAIVPLVDQRNLKAAVKGWNQGYDPKQDIEFHSLGLLTGERSGITVWDIDRHDVETPVTPNVLTVKGQHVYTPYRGEKGQIGLAPNLDLLSDGRYAIFHGQGKSFQTSDLASSHVMADWFASSYPSSCIVIKKSLEAEYESRVKKQSYNNWLRDEHSIELDLKAIRRQYVNLARVMSEGSRHHALYRYSREAYRCGLDMDELAEAALDSGLDRSEIDGIIDSAMAGIELNPGRTVWDRVQVWKDTSWPSVPDFAHPTLEVIASAAIRTNNLSPWLPQQDIVDALAALGRPLTQQGVSSVIRTLEGKYGVIRRKHMGFHGEGYLNPLCYTLCIEGDPVSEVVA